MQRSLTIKLATLWATVMCIGIATHAQVPDTLSYQGYLADDSGQALQDPEVIQFALYNVATGGVPLWSEFQNIFPAQGLFSTTFGNDANPLPANLFDTPLYLGVTVGVDAEMSPRTELKSSAFSHKAKDAETVGGFTAGQLNQSGAVATLTSDLSAVDADVTQLQTDVSLAQSDVVQLQTDLVTTVDDLTTVENTLPTLQSLVTQNCAVGSSIRQIFSGGTVSCETDDAGPWIFDGDAYVTGTRVGIGTSAPAAALMIDAAVDEDPFRARVASSTKLRVHNNGSVSVGTSTAGVENGLHVAGFTGLGTSVPTHQLTVRDTDWQTLITNPNVGGGNWYLGASSDAWAAGGGKFLIGPTLSSQSAALTIDASKNIGISTTSPSTRLHVSGGSDVNPVSGGYITVGLDTGANIAIDSNEIMARNNGASTTLALNAEGGEVRINSGGDRDSDAFEVRGRVYFDNGGNSGMRITATNSNPTNALFEPTLYEEGLVGSSTRPFWRMYSREFYASSPLEYKTYSDRSLKYNVMPINQAIATVSALEGVTYALNNHPMDDAHRTPTAHEKFLRENQLGFIAQDVEKILPQLVTEDDSSGLKTVAYMGVIPILVEAIKELKQELDAQRAEFEQLKKSLN